MSKVVAFVFLSMLALAPLIGFSQDSNQVELEKIIAVVGDEYILLSDLEIRHREEKANRGKQAPDKCELLFQMMQEKMLIVQAQRDSVIVTQDEVETQLTQRMNFFIGQFGSEKALEDYFDKTIAQIKEELRANMKDQLTIDKMKGELLAGLKVSPQEVRNFYNNIPEDSLPKFEEEYEIGQVVVEVKVSRKVREKAMTRLKRIRQEIIEGKTDFEFAASLYSDDPGSQPRGGDLGWANRSDYVPEFSAAAFTLKKDSISGLVKTKFGYHIIKLIDRRGDNIHLKHILITPKPNVKNKIRTKNFVDSLRNLVLKDTFTFNDIAYRYSEDEQSRNNGGMVYDQRTSSTRIPAENLDPSISYGVDTLEVGEISHPLAFRTKENKDAYRLLYLKTKTAPHKANLKQDYSRLSDMALNKRKQEYLVKWTFRKASSMYMRVDQQYLNCPQVSRLMKANQSTN